ncbi:La-domain-containing protein [Wallemia mellicola]|uniref:La-domain-containing protein n=1 Tax=Wallemia mellicola TaxID=1708541 RepID=A0A4T0MDK6_9BASI|nr:La-domain-containing protein [Wallemia mellicola]
MTTNVWQSRQAVAAPQELPVKDEKSWPSASDAKDRDREAEKTNKEKSQSSTPTDSNSTRRGKKNWVTVPVEEVLPVQSRRSQNKKSNKAKRSDANKSSQRANNKSTKSKNPQQQQRKSSNRKPSKTSDKNQKNFAPVVPAMPSSFQMFGAPNTQAGHTYAPMPMPTPITTTNYPLDPLRFYLLGQLEYYFTTQNLVRDFFLRQQMDSDGWVDIPIFTTFNRVKALSVDLYLLRDVFSMSHLVEVYFFAENAEPSQKEEGVLQKESLDMSQVQKEIDIIASNTNPVGKVRLAHGVWKKWVLPDAPKSTIDIDSLPPAEDPQFDENATPVEASKYNEEIAAKSGHSGQSNQSTQPSQQSASSHTIDNGSNDANKESK